MSALVAGLLWAALGGVVAVSLVAWIGRWQRRRIRDMLAPWAAEHERQRQERRDAEIRHWLNPHRPVRDDVLWVALGATEAEAAQQLLDCVWSPRSD